MNRPLVSVVLVAWNSGEGLPRAAAALRRSAEDARVTLQFVIVDNASLDGAVDSMELEGSDVVIRNRLNVGFGVAAAQGAAVASGEWVLFINPDVVVSQSFFPAMCDVLAQAPPSLGTLVPEMRYMSNPQVVNCRGVTVDEAGIPAEIDAGAGADTDVATLDVFGGTTGCWLVRASALEAVGGLELSYFAYLEDVDLSVRLQQAGYGSRLVPEAVVYHEGSASFGEGSPLKTRLVARNRRLFFRLHGPKGLRAQAWRALVESGHMTISILSGGGLNPIAGRVDAVRLRSYVRFARASRRLDRRPISTPPYSPRAGMLETLRRKRARIERFDDTEA